MSLNDDWKQALDRFHKAELFAGVSKTTRANRRGHVRAAAVWLSCPLNEVTSHRLQQYLDHRAFQPATRRNYVKSFRAFWRWCYESGVTGTNAALDLRLDLDSDEEDDLRARARVVRETHRTGPDPLPVPEPWATWLCDWRRYSRAGGAPETTIKTRLYHLEMCARALSPITPDDVTLDDLIEWIVRHDWGSETRRSIRSTLRNFYQWAVETGRRDDNPATALPRVKASAPVPKPATEQAYQAALIDAPPRERLMLRLSAELGLRRSEVAQVHTRDIMNVVTGGYALVVHGKGSKERMIPLSRTLAADLRDYGNGGGYLFHSSNRSGHLSPEYVGRRVAACLPVGVSMHCLRHRFATAAYAASGDLLTVQKLLGHSDPNTTQRYVAVTNDTARSLIDQIEQASSPLRVSR